MDLHWMILRHATRAGSGRRYHWIGWLLLVLAVPVSVVAMVTKDLRLAAGILSFAIGLMLLLWMLAFFESVLNGMHRPAQACLVPRLHQHVLRLSAGLWLIFTLVVGGLDGYSEGHILGGILLTGFMLNRVVWMLGGSIWHGGLVLLWPLMDAKRLALLPLPVQELLAHPVALPALALLVLADAWVGVRALVPDGGDRHFDLVAKSRKAISMIWSNELGIVRKARYAQVDSAGGAQRLAVGVGMNIPSSRLAQVIAGLVVIPFAVAAIDTYVMPVRGIDSSAFGSGLVFILIGAAAAARELVAKLSRTQGEQQLLCLAPGVARGVGLNRDVLYVMLRQWALVTGGFTALAVVVLLSLDAKQETVRVAIGLACLAQLYLPMYLLKDYARMRPNIRATAGLGAMVVGLIGMGLCLILEKFLPFVGLAICVVAGVGAGYVSWAKFKQLSGGIELLPVGHAE